MKWALLSFFISLKRQKLTCFNAPLPREDEVKWHLPSRGDNRFFFFSPKEGWLVMNMNHHFFRSSLCVFFFSFFFFFPFCLYFNSSLRFHLSHHIHGSFFFLFGTHAHSVWGLGLGRSRKCYSFCPSFFISNKSRHKYNHQNVLRPSSQLTIFSFLLAIPFRYFFSGGHTAGFSYVSLLYDMF